MSSPVTRVSRFPQKAPVPRRRVFRLSRSRLPVLALAVFMLYLCISFSFQFHRLQILKQEIRQVQQQIGEIQVKNAELRDQLKKVQSDAYIEQVAREKLGLVKPGEVRIVPLQSGSEER